MSKSLTIATAAVLFATLSGCGVSQQTYDELDAAFRQFVMELPPPDSNGSIAH